MRASVKEEGVKNARLRQGVGRNLLAQLPLHINKCSPALSPPKIT